MAYLLFKTLHIIFVITWFAALFYLPRLFVYHASAEDRISKERFKVMERKLYRGIMTPSMIAAIFCGSALLWLNPSWLNGGWLHVKLMLVALIVVYHFWCRRILIQFKEDRNERSHRWFRWFNEAPTFALFAVVALVVFKPF
ncbi:protoporphyrinogen oxidase HemJ [Reinekea marina]|uniref:Protoporphyrinogen IX oxidase n=1 Tax=Reinekea marina TaxID=1310421 RepID=A0ABV7WU45_9GAMM|nr:protoporphyrinogen oxidase HemJ [Reinekea marina]MDN3647962.1 protoporphyrinogen oxidase HemJ [Reinekea marina]